MMLQSPSQKLLNKVVTYLFLFAVAAMLILPFLWILSTSLKGNESIF